jgi:hypothetical protein
MTAKPSAKPIPKVVSFQNPLPRPHHYRGTCRTLRTGSPRGAITFKRKLSERYQALGRQLPSQELRHHLWRVH